MSNLLLAFFAYLADRLFGEFTFIRHPVIMIGQLVSWFETRFYRDTVGRGIILLLFTLGSVTLVTVLLLRMLALLPDMAADILAVFIASMFLAHRMLYDSVLAVMKSETPRAEIAMLVSRDTEDLSESEVNKAAIETYAENLSDGVIAPLFYLLLFGLSGIVIYKTVNTLDSMVGYRNPRYERFGKASARLDDLLNYLPSRLSALMILLLSRAWPTRSAYRNAQEHASPNAGHPITAMALAIDIRLGGDTRYFGELKAKPWFGTGKTVISKEDVLRALALRNRIDLLILLTLALTGLFLA